jgi:protein subunit release factor A
MNIENKDIVITMCKSPKTNLLGAHVGVQIKYFETNITVQSINHKSQYMNNLAALKFLKDELVRLRYQT